MLPDDMDVTKLILLYAVSSSAAMSIDSLIPAPICN